MSTEIIDTYLKEKELGLRYAGTAASPRTLQRYRQHLTHIEDLLDKDLEELTLDDGARVIQMLTEAGNSPSTINGVLSAARGFYNWAIKKELVDMRLSPVDGIMLRKRHASVPKTITLTQFNRLIKIIEDEDALSISRAKNTHGLANAPWVNDKSRLGRKVLPLKIMYYGGLRVSEVASLHVNDIVEHEEGIIVNQGKGGRNRFVYLPSHVLKELVAYIKEHDLKKYVFAPNEMHRQEGQREHIDPRQKYTVLKRAVRSAGYPSDISPHTLRHSFATATLQKTGRLDLVQDMLGHANSDTTRIYARNFRPDIRRLMKETLANDE